MSDHTRARARHWIGSVSGLVVMLAGLSIVASPPASAAPGDTDPTFGTAGRVDIGAPSGVQVEQQGTKVLVATTAFKDGVTGYDILVRRYSAAGVLDTTFGPNGTGMAYVGSANPDSASDMVIAPDGDIVVAGRRTLGTADVAVGRLTADGAVDTTFGTAGFAVITQTGEQSVKRVVALADGRVVVLADESFIGSSSLYAFTPAGLPDASFGGDGIVEVDLRAGNTEAYYRGNGFGLAVDHSGRLVVAGRNSYVAVARYLPTGVIDTSFGNLGAVIQNLGYDEDVDEAGQPTTAINYAQDVTVAADGTILTYGRLYWQGKQSPSVTGPVPHQGSGMALARFSPAGEFTGHAVAPTDATAAGSLAQGANGAVYGLIPSSPTFRAGPTGREERPAQLVRFTPDHAFDPTFGTNGFASARMGTGTLYQGDDPHDVKVQADGRVLLGGMTESANFTYRSGLVRLLADAGTPQTPTDPDPVTPVSPVTGPTTPVVPPTAAPAAPSTSSGSSAACASATSGSSAAGAAVTGAKAKVTSAKKKLKKAKRADASAAVVKKTKKKVSAAQANLEKAEAAAAAAVATKNSAC